VVCQGNSTILTATGGLNYTWYPGGVSGASITVTPGTSQAFIVHVTDANGCSANDTTNITVHQNPVANAGPSHLVCPGGSATLSAFTNPDY